MHDWTLLTVQLDWESAKAELRVRDATSQERAVWIEGVRALWTEKSQPWGPSNSINEVLLQREAADGLLAVTIQLHSGDAIHLRAHAFEIEHADP